MDISFPLIIENKHVSTSLVKLKFLLLWQYIHYINFKIHLKYLIIKMIHYSFYFIFSLFFLITTPPGVGVGLGEGRTYSVYFPLPGSSPVGKKKKKSPVWKLPQGPEFWRFPSTVALEVTILGRWLQICPCSFSPSVKGKSHSLLISSITLQRKINKLKKKKAIEKITRKYLMLSNEKHHC